MIGRKQNLNRVGLGHSFPTRRCAAPGGQHAWLGVIKAFTAFAAKTERRALRFFGRTVGSGGHAHQAPNRTAKPLGHSLRAQRRIKTREESGNRRLGEFRRLNACAAYSPKGNGDLDGLICSALLLCRESSWDNSPAAPLTIRETRSLTLAPYLNGREAARGRLSVQPLRGLQVSRKKFSIALPRKGLAWSP